MCEIEKLKEAIEWFENSTCDNDPMHTDDKCPDCRNNRVALKALQEKLDREKEPKIVRCSECNYYHPNDINDVCHRLDGLIEPADDDYCSYGTPREVDYEL